MIIYQAHKFLLRHKFMNNKLYLIFTNLEIKYSGVELDKKYSSYNNTIIDGEYILNTQFNKYIYAAFDILYYKGENVQTNPKLEERYEKLNDVIAKCFGFDFSRDLVSYLCTQLT